MGSGESPSLLMLGWDNPHAFDCQRSLALTFLCSACSFAAAALKTDLVDAPGDGEGLAEQIPLGVMLEIWRQ